MTLRTCLKVALTTLLLGSCAAPKFTTPWQPESDRFTTEDWHLDADGAANIAARLPNASEGAWFGESGTAGDGVGFINYRGNRYSGTWANGLLEGPFRLYRREMLLAEGVAEAGELTHGTLYEHYTFKPIYSSSWEPERTEFIRSKGGTHSVICFQGDFKNGRPHSGRFYTTDRKFHPTSYIEGTKDESGGWVGDYASYELYWGDYDKLEFTDENFRAIEKGKYVDGLREGHWTGPKVDEYLVRGLRNGLCKTQVIVQSHAHDIIKSKHAWLSGYFKDGQVDGIVRLTYDGTEVDFAEYQGTGDGSDDFAYGWHLVQPRIGPPHMIAVAHSGLPVVNTMRDLPEGTTWNSLMAYAEVLELGDGVTWYGPVVNGEPAGFGRRFGYQDAVLYEEGFFKDGVPDGILIGMTERNDSTGFQLLYAWDGGIELNKERGFETYTLDDVAEGKARYAAIQKMRADHAFKYRPESERVWRVLAWEGKVISPEGVEAKPRVVNGPLALRAGDIVWIERDLDGIRRGFMQVDITPTDQDVQFRGYSKKLYFSANDLITVFSRSETGSAFSKLTTRCSDCDGTGQRTIQGTRQYKEHARNYNPALGGMVDTTYLVTERTSSEVNCEVCSGWGIVLDRYLGH